MTTKKNPVATQAPADAPDIESQEQQDQVSSYPSNLPTVGSEFISERQLTPAQISQAVSVLAKVTAYTGAKSHGAAEYLNMPLKIFGAISQPISLSKEVVDNETGEITTAYTPANRIVCKMENGEVLSFVSKAADSFFNGFVFPVFGKGDFPAPLTLKITQVSKGQGRTYNFSVVG